MIKFIIISVLCFGFIDSKIEEKKDGNSFHLVIDIDGNDCCNDCCDGGDGSEEEDLCLNTDNSQKISKALVDVIHSNNYSIAVLDDLKIAEFMSSKITYAAFAKNIKSNKFSYEGYKKLRKMVKKYKVCEKVCKVYFELRKALRENSASAVISEVDDGKNTIEIKVDGPLIIFSDCLDEIVTRLNDKPSIRKVSFLATTMMVDDNMYQENWHGICVSLNVDTVIVCSDSFWDVTGNQGRYLTKLVNPKLC